MAFITTLLVFEIEVDKTFTQRQQVDYNIWCSAGNIALSFQKYVLTYYPTHRKRCGGKISNMLSGWHKDVVDIVSCIQFLLRFTVFAHH